MSDWTPEKLREIPMASRKFGWCQDYTYGPAAQHDRCDGVVGPVRMYRCPCDCHRWDELGKPKPQAKPKTKKTKRRIVVRSP